MMLSDFETDQEPEDADRCVAVDSSGSRCMLAKLHTGAHSVYPRRRIFAGAVVLGIFMGGLILTAALYLLKELPR